MVSATHLMQKQFEIFDVYKSSYAVYCRAKNIDTLSIEGFLPSKRKGLLQQLAHNEVYALARLTFYENLLIGQAKQLVPVFHINGCLYQAS